MTEMPRPEDHYNAMQGMVTNILRVMRGGGNPHQIIGNIEAIARHTSCDSEDSHHGYTYRCDTSAALANACIEWDEGLRRQMAASASEDGHGNFHEKRLSFKFYICKAALRIMAAEIDGNWIERAKGESDLWDAVNRLMVERDEEREARETARMEEARAETRRIMAQEIKAKRHNERAIVAANDNGKGSFVYFITDGEAIKIGKANNPKSRLSGLQTSHHKPLRIIHLTPGGEAFERELHFKFSHLRIRGEWFRDHKDLHDFIRKDKANNALGNAA